MSCQFSLSAWILAFSLLALSMMVAPAKPEAARVPAQPVGAPENIPPLEQGVQTSNCYDTRNMESCVTVFRGIRLSPHLIAVPQAISEQDRDFFEQRDRRWVERCRPTIHQDRYGMRRYRYAAEGCEYGRLD